MRLSDDGPPTTEEWAGSVCTSLVRLEGVDHRRSPTPAASRSPPTRSATSSARRTTRRRSSSPSSAISARPISRRATSSSSSSTSRRTELESSFDSLKDSAEAAADAPPAEFLQQLAALASDFAALQNGDLDDGDDAAERERRRGVEGRARSRRSPTRPRASRYERGLRTRVLVRHALRDAPRRGGYHLAVQAPGSSVHRPDGARLLGPAPREVDLREEPRGAGRQRHDRRPGRASRPRRERPERGAGRGDAWVALRSLRPAEPLGASLVRRLPRRVGRVDRRRRARGRPRDPAREVVRVLQVPQRALPCRPVRVEHLDAVPARRHLPPDRRLHRRRDRALCASPFSSSS